MIRGFRNVIISLAFGANVRALRLRRILSGLGKPRIRAVDHVTIPVHDLDEAQRFYCDLIGGALLARIDNDFVSLLIGFHFCDKTFRKTILHG